MHANKNPIARAAALAARRHSAAMQPTQMLQMPVLVLNASYEPINICGARRALVLVLKGIARTEEEHGLTLHAQRSRIAMPSVIRLLEYRRIPHQTRALSRKNILLRDRNTCQYCGVVLPSGELTLDHVIPRSRGGNSTWENLVACCHACNRRKGNRMLNEIDDMICCASRVPSRSTPAARSCACWAAATTAGANISSIKSGIVHSLKLDEESKTRIGKSDLSLSRRCRHPARRPLASLPSPKLN